MRSRVLTQECLLHISIARMRWYHISVFEVIYPGKWSHCSPNSNTDTEADCTPPAGLWAQRKPTVKNQEIYQRTDTESSVSLSLTSPVCSATVSDTWSKYALSATSISDYSSPCPSEPSSDPLLPSYLHVIKRDDFFSGIEEFSKAWIARQVGLLSVVTQSKNAIAN